jgi:hypothetical protein
MGLLFRRYEDSRLAAFIFKPEGKDLDTGYWGRPLGYFFCTGCGVDSGIVGNAHAFYTPLQTNSV